MVRRFRVLLLGVLLAALLPVTAAAQSGTAPPGNSAVDQYRESVPAPDGPRRSLSERERRELRRLGADGVALAATIDRQGGVSAAETSAAPSSGSERRPRGRASGGDGASDRDRGSATDRDDAAADGAEAAPADDRDVVGVSTSAVGDQLPLGWMAAIAALLAVVGIVRWRRA